MARKRISGRGVKVPPSQGEMELSYVEETASAGLARSGLPARRSKAVRGEVAAESWQSRVH